MVEILIGLQIKKDNLSIMNLILLMVERFGEKLFHN